MGFLSALAWLPAPPPAASSPSCSSARWSAVAGVDRRRPRGRAGRRSWQTGERAGRCWERRALELGRRERLGVERGLPGRRPLRPRPAYPPSEVAAASDSGLSLHLQEASRRRWDHAQLWGAAPGPDQPFFRGLDSGPSLPEQGWPLRLCQESQENRVQDGELGLFPPRPRVPERAGLA